MKDIKVKQEGRDSSLGGYVDIYYDHSSSNDCIDIKMIRREIETDQRMIDLNPHGYEDGHRVIGRLDVADADVPQLISILQMYMEGLTRDAERRSSTLPYSN